MAGKIQNDLTAKQFGIWKVTKYLGRSKYECECTVCGEHKEIVGYFLIENKLPKCRHEKKVIDLAGMDIGEWHVIRRTQAGREARWLCRCSCGTEREVLQYTLINGTSTSCGHSASRTVQNLAGMDFGDWHVIKYNKETHRWTCQCSCGVIRDVPAYQLTTGKSKSCGHSTTGFKDLTGQDFGEWHVLSLSAIQTMQGSTLWECQCSCGTIRDISSYALTSGKSKSCGCIASRLREQTCLERYSVKHASQVNTLGKRTKEQLALMDSSEDLVKAIEGRFEEKPSVIQIAEMLGVSRGSAKAYLKRHNLEHCATIGTTQVSGYEKALNQMFPCSHRSDKTVLKGKELDLYYPEQRFAIEFNGNYWHSELKKERLYHQNKTIQAAKSGVQVFHIFEYEWNNRETRRKIMELLNSKIYPDNLTIIHARECEIKEITHQQANEFMDKHHLQGRATAKFNIGTFLNGELIGVMTFGAPRYSKEYSYELVRLAWKFGIAVVGGAERMFKAFIRKLSPDSIVSYCDISKFNGKVYTRLGFKALGITQPNYKWVNIENNEAIPRYKTTKQKLVSRGLGSLDETEADIMTRLGYVRIYDSGNLKLAWKNTANQTHTEGGTGVTPGDKE